MAKLCREAGERGARSPGASSVWRSYPALALSWFPYLGNRDVVYTVGVL